MRCTRGGGTFKIDWQLATIPHSEDGELPATALRRTSLLRKQAAVEVYRVSRVVSASACEGKPHWSQTRPANRGQHGSRPCGDSPADDNDHRALRGGLGWQKVQVKIFSTITFPE
jgi:hypothetical protein